MNALIIAPVLIPLLTASATLLAWRNGPIQRWIGLAGMVAVLAAGLGLLAAVWNQGEPRVLVTELGRWPAPFGITLVADLLSAVMIVIAGVKGLAVCVFSLGSVDREREAFGYYPLFHILVMGVCGAFLTGDIFNLYVWFEVMLLASFVLMSLGGERAQLEGAIKYVTLNLVSSAIFLAAVGIVYGVTGTLNMADLAQKMELIRERGLDTTLAMLFLISFGIKAAVFPLFFWLPASYHTPPVAVTAIFAALLTKVGVYSLVRFFTLIFVQDTGYTHTLILVIAGFTMVTGVLGAVAQIEFRRLLSFHIVSQIGYLLMGLGLFTKAALAGVVFFMVHVILAKSALFLVSGVAYRLRGTYDLKQLGGLYQTKPALAVLFLVPAMSLAGFPPLAGFFAKLALVKAGLEAEQYAIVATALAVSILTLFSMIKIWTEAFWKMPPEAALERARVQQPEIERHLQQEGQPMSLMVAPIVAVAILIVLIGVGAEPVYHLASEAADQLIDRDTYILAVLGENP